MMSYEMIGPAEKSKSLKRSITELSSPRKAVSSARKFLDQRVTGNVHAGNIRKSNTRELCAIAVALKSLFLKCAVNEWHTLNLPFQLSIFGFLRQCLLVLVMSWE